MVLNIFTDGASRGNPGNSGVGIVIYEGKKLTEEISEYLGKKTNNEAEYLAVIKGLERVKEINEKKVNFFADSEFLIKQINGQYKVKAEKIKPLYEKVMSLIEGLEVKFYWIPREENKIADSLANKGIDKRVENLSELKLKLDKAFFGKVSCLKIQMNKQNEVYFHMGLLNQQTKEWNWEKVKMSSAELGEIVNLLEKHSDNCSFFHSFGDKKTQIRCNKNDKSFSIKINEVSKNLGIGEAKVLQILLEECIRLENFT